MIVGVLDISLIEFMSVVVDELCVVLIFVFVVVFVVFGVFIFVV